MKDGNKAPASGLIKLLTGSQAGSTFTLSRPVTTIGRDPNNDIILTDPSVSRVHARILHNGSQWSIEKIASYNKLTINKHDVAQAVLHDNDMVGLGGGITTFLFFTSAGAQKLPDPPPTDLLPQVSPQSKPPSPLIVLPQSESLVTERAPLSGSLLGIGVPRLEISTNTSSAKQAYQLTQQVISIGRDPSNDIVIDARVISAFHAQIVRENNSYVLVHPHPSRQRTLNGLLYQGSYIPGDKHYRKTLNRGDIFRIGDENGTLVTLTYNDGSGAPQEILPEIHPIALGATTITLGRHGENTVVLNHPQVSAHHARVEQVPEGGYRIIDLGSTNHVYVNAQQVNSQLLKPGDEIRIGPFKFTYTGTQLTQFDESNSIRVDALHLKKVGNNQTILINDISLAIPPRKFVALVGGSGAGKSTLMDALNGLRPAQEGAVLYNGQNYYSALAAFRTQLGYVPQQDIVHLDISVERALYYAARMRLPDDFTGAQISQRINEVLVDVEMEHRRNMLVSKLSGGQRKRVSIALELLAKPSIFFLDEPTSGLDPGLDRKMMFLLRRLADRGHTIILVTHATNNINACDYVCFLAQGGRLAYFGPPDQAKLFFNKDDFAEIYTELEPTDTNPAIPVQAEAHFRGSPDYKKFVIDPLNQGPAGRTSALPQAANTRPLKRGDPWKQFILLSMRYIELLKNDVGNLLILLLQAPIIGLILLLIVKYVTIPGVFEAANVASIHGGDAQKVLFVMAFAAVMFGCINGAREIVKEAPIYRRERTVNLGIIPYMSSKIAVLGVLCLLQSAVLVVIVNAAEPFHQGILLPVGLEVYITLALTSLAGLMVGLAVSALAPNNDRAMSLIPIILIPQVIFAGTIFPLKSGFMQIFGIFFAVRWAMAALGSSLGLNSSILGGDKLFGENNIYHGTLASTYSHADASAYLLLLWLALLIMIVLLGWAIAYFLKRKDIRV